MLRPIQLEVGTSNGAEAAVHTTRHFAGHLTPDEMLVKLDITNAFNSLCRDKAVLKHTPQLAHLVFPIAMQQNHH
jgi:hypothetical protein